MKRPVCVVMPGDSAKRDLAVRKAVHAAAKMNQAGRRECAVDELVVIERHIAFESLIFETHKVFPVLMSGSAAVCLATAAAESFDSPMNFSAPVDELLPGSSAAPIDGSGQPR